jgi:hypothetical protein
MMHGEYNVKLSSIFDPTSTEADAGMASDIMLFN